MGDNIVQIMIRAPLFSLVRRCIQRPVKIPLKYLQQCHCFFTQISVRKCSAKKTESIVICKYTSKPLKNKVLVCQYKNHAHTLQIAKEGVVTSVCVKESKSVKTLQTHCSIKTFKFKQPILIALGSKAVPFSYQIQQNFWKVRLNLP